MYSKPSKSCFDKSTKRCTLREEKAMGLYLDRNRYRLKDKSDRQTHDKVIDKRVANNLRRLLNTGCIGAISGCISSGKEANIYYGVTGLLHPIALKIYKTSILDYKNRSRYIEGEYRYRMWNYSRNPRKMVRKWAEKEYRNLNRLRKAGIPCPEPIKLTDNILIMSFLGRNELALPKLKDAPYRGNYCILFNKCIFLMREMYQKCHLVHGDLSEYNILCDFSIESEHQLYIIDVSQSVESYSPRAIYFLLRDIENVSIFFRKHNVNIPPMKLIFDFITDFTISNENLPDAWARALKRDIEYDDEVFKGSFIPKNLSEIINIEMDAKNCKAGNCKDLLYIPLTGMNELLIPRKSANKSKAINGRNNYISIMSKLSSYHRLKQTISNIMISYKNLTHSLYDEAIQDPIIDNSEGWIDEEPIGSITPPKKLIKTKQEIKNARKANKKAVKEENREKRQNKIPKYEKKRERKKHKHR